MMDDLDRLRAPCGPRPRGDARARAIGAGLDAYDHAWRSAVAGEAPTPRARRVVAACLTRATGRVGPIPRNGVAAAALIGLAVLAWAVTMVGGSERGGPVAHSPTPVGPSGGATQATSRPDAPEATVHREPLLRPDGSGSARGEVHRGPFRDRGVMERELHQGPLVAEPEEGPPSIDHGREGAENR